MEQNQETETTTAVEPRPQNMPSIRLNDRGVFMPQNIEEAFRVANAFYKSKLLPTRFNSAEMVLTAMQFVLELGLKPLTAMRQLAVVNGTPSLFGDLPLSLCYASGSLEFIKEWLIDKDSNEICSRNGNLNTEAWGAVCVVKRRGDREPIERFFTMADAQRAGITNGPVWKAYPKLMLKYRARSHALKDKFPDALNGISIAEYDFNTIPSENDAAIVVDTQPEKTDKAKAFQDMLRDERSSSAGSQPAGQAPAASQPTPAHAASAPEPEVEQGSFAAFNESTVLSNSAPAAGPSKAELAKAISAAGRKLGLGMPAIDARCQKLFKKTTGQMNEIEMAELLNVLEQEARAS